MKDMVVALLIITLKLSGNMSEDREADVPNYGVNINMTPPDKMEVDWGMTLDSIRNRAIDKEEDNILLPIYRYSKLANVMEYHIGTIIHEC